MAKGKLSEYSAKRSFKETPEPGPVPVEGREGPLLFVIQQHSATRLHYDFRIECDGVLMSWAVPKGPSLDPAEKRLAVRTENHPFDYGSFEGIIPAGQYGAGEVIVWDCGVYSPDEDGEVLFHDREKAERRVREGVEKGKLSLLLRGEKTKGSFALVRTKDAKNWLLIKHKDRFVAKTDLTAQDRSVLSGVTVEEMTSVPVHRMPAALLAPAGPARALPDKLAPMHAETGERAFNSADWMWEPKLDGYRALALIGPRGVQLRSRRGLQLGEDFPRLVAELGKQSVDSMVLDGEIVAFDAAGKPSFGAMQNRSSAAERAVFYCFDLLYFAGVDLRRSCYADRRRYLAQCLLPSPLVQLVHAQEDGVALHEAALKSGFEGVVGKRKDSLYEAGKRSAAWQKVKAIDSADFVVGGYTKGKGARAALGALLLGYWEDGKLRYASHVGSGFDERTLKRTKALLEPLQRKANPFSEKPELNAPTTWVEPKVVAEVKYQGWTHDGHLRAPVFLRLRDDVDAREVRREAREKPSSPGNEILEQLDNAKSALTLAVGRHQIKLTHLDRVYWPADPALKQPALTKRDLLRYFAQAGPYMLPHLVDRPLTMIRMPDGIGGQRFFQKHWEQEKPPFVETITVFSGHKDESHEYLLCNNLPTLLWLAQSGTLEFHVWHSRAKVGGDSPVNATDYASSLSALESSILNYPDYVVFDIDPYIYSGKEAPGDEPELNTVAFEKGKEVAFQLRELLGKMSLDPVVKTSGKTGLHVFLPIKRTIDFDAAREVSELVGRHLVRLRPKDITVEWSVPKRTGKIFMDYNMNVRGKTLNSAYSPRGAPGAPVSMPLTWEELAGAHPLDFRLYNVAERLAEQGDRWADVLERKQSLEGVLEAVKS
ncbi:MAG: DNA ligase D [Betaproteobacteria bacterium]|nr:DNA ligase D [Betaproteobacteria bacterium]